MSLSASQTDSRSSPIRESFPRSGYESFVADFEHQRGASIPKRYVFLAAAISALAHSLMLVIMGLLLAPEPSVSEGAEIIAATAEEREELKTLEKPDDPIEIDVDSAQLAMLAEATAVDPSTMVIEAATLSETMNNINVEFAEIGIETAPADALTLKLGGAGALGTSITGSRSEAGKQAAIRQRGGSDATEAAVAKALEWLARHQLPDGGWTFEFRDCPGCDGACRNSGSLRGARNAATALALLPFLGAGQTHQVGKYQRTVLGGLIYLTDPRVNRNIKLTAAGLDFTTGGGNFYTQGLCAMALSEAYAMSEDRNLIPPAQAALNYILYAQDPSGGGWRYSPRQPGDTSVTGWCFMALKSGHMGSLQVPLASPKFAERFLLSVSQENGAYYGYDRPGRGVSTTAVGLLLRMYAGAKREEPWLQKGCEYLAKTGPQKNNVYFNYYATQVLHQYEGPLWETWNKSMRDMITTSQETKGHAAGSWYVEGGHGESGGRLYTTSLNTMILEVYYRHLPLYRTASTSDDDF